MFAKKKEKTYSKRYVAVTDVKLSIDNLKETIAEEDYDSKTQARIRTMEGILSSMQLDYSRD